jgi:hypothetical protein
VNLVSGEMQTYNSNVLSFRNVINLPEPFKVRGIQPNVIDCCDKPISNVKLTIYDDCPAMQPGDDCPATTLQCVSEVYTTTPSTYCLPLQKEQYSFVACKACETATTDPGYISEITTKDLTVMKSIVTGFIDLQQVGPCTKIAADVNNSGHISTIDVLLAHRHILGIEKFKTCYKFFSDNTYTKTCTNVNIRESDKRTDFFGVRMGDVDKCVKKENLERVVNVTVNDHYEPNDEVTLDITGEHLDDVDGMQLGLQFDPQRLELIRTDVVELPVNEAGNFGLEEVADGKIRFAWYAPVEALSLSSEQPLFRLHFRALSEINRLSDVIASSDDVLLGELVDSDLTKNNHLSLNIQTSPAPKIAANFSNPANVAAFHELSALAVPNPFNGETSLKISTQSNETATLTVVDSYGRIIGQQSTLLYKGLNKVALSNSNDWATGYYSYIITTATKTCTGKLIKF